MHSPNVMLNASETSSEEHKSLKAVADSVCMSGPVSVGDTSVPWWFSWRILEGEQFARFPVNLRIPDLKAR
jgi:hypothetical protein